MAILSLLALRVEMSKAIPLSDVPEPKGLRDIIQSEYEDWKAYRGAGVPDKLFSTFWASKGTGVPSHDRGEAIDIVTDGYGSRPYLIEFGVWLFIKRPELSVYFYSMKYEPHVHVGLKNYLSKSPSVLAVNKGAKGQFDVFPREEVKSKAGDIIKKLQSVRATYPAGVVTDWDALQAMLEGKIGGAGNWLKRYWWIGAISIFLLGAVFIIKKIKDRG